MKDVQGQTAGTDFLVSLPEPREVPLGYGYNVIHAWPELQDLAQGNMDAARMSCWTPPAAIRSLKNRIVVVFDAYRVQNRAMEESHDYNIHVVFTKGPRLLMSTLKSSPMTIRKSTTSW